MTIEVMKQALEALEADEQDMVADKDGHMVFRVDAAITALRQAIEQAEQAQPVAWMMINQTHLPNSKSLHWAAQTDWHVTWEAVPLYTAQPPRQPLTHPQIHELDWPDGVAFEEILLFARAIEAAHNIKGEA
jgi:hypothetical protein